MTPSLEVWPTKAKEALSPHKDPLDINPVFQSLGGKVFEVSELLAFLLS